MKPTALLVVDIQRGAFDGVRCPPIDKPAELVGSVIALVTAAHNAGSPVVFIQHCDDPGQAFEEGTVHWELHERLLPWPHDILIKKYASSAFENTALETTLRTLQITDLVVCGLQSEFCVSNTSKAALALGFHVTVAQDAHGTWPSEGRTARAIADGVNKELCSLGAVLATTDDVASSLRARV